MIGEPTLVSRMWRLGPWSGNRLMRGSYRLESSVFLPVVALVLILVPLAAAFGTATHTRLDDQSRADRENRHQIAAVLLEDATVNLADTTPATGATGQAPARWAVDGTTRTGQVLTAPEAKAGHTISIWIDPAGKIVDRAEDRHRERIRGRGRRTRIVDNGCDDLSHDDDRNSLGRNEIPDVAVGPRVEEPRKGARVAGQLTPVDVERRKTMTISEG